MLETEELANAFRPGVSLIVVQDTGNLCELRARPPWISGTQPSARFGRQATLPSLDSSTSSLAGCLVARGANAPYVVLHEAPDLGLEWEWEKASEAWLAVVEDLDESAVLLNV